MQLIGLLLTLLVIAAQAADDEYSVPRTLLLAQTLSVKDSHSRFLQYLEATGRELDVREVSDDTLRLRDWDIWLYNEVIIFAPQAEDLGGTIDSAALAEFVDAGHGVLLAVDTQVTESQRELAAEFGVDLEPSGHVVLDHFHHADGDPDHAAVMADCFLDSAGIFGNARPQTPVLFRGIGMSIPPESRLGMIALSGSATAYSAVPGKKPAEATALAGANVGLTALVQSRNGARVAVVGSVDLFSDAFCQASVPANGRTAPSGNEAFAAAIAGWVFGERGVLKVSNLHHQHADEPKGSPSPGSYRINDHLMFSMDLEELTAGEGWVPYKGDDVQVEMVMLDPYVRKTLRHNGQGTFSAAIHVPDVYGVFKLVVYYCRPGYSSIEIQEEIPVRPYKHNEFERFLTAAYPFYASAASTMAAFLAFGFVFLYQK